MSISLDDPAVCVQFSPQGDRLAVVTKAKFVRLYAADNLELLGEFPTELGECLCFSPDGKQLAVQRNQRTTVLLDTETMQVVNEIRSGRVPQVRCLTFSHDGSLLAAAGGSGPLRDKGIVKIWNIETGESVREMQEFVNDISRMAFCPDGNVFVHLGNVIQIRDTETWTEIVRREDVIDPAIADITADARKTLYVEPRTPAVRIYDTQTSTCKDFAILHPQALAWAPDAETFAAGFCDGSIYPWDVERDEPLAVACTGSNVIGLDYSPDGQRLVSVHADGELACWDVPQDVSPAPQSTRKVVEITESRVLKQNRGRFIHVKYSPDGRLLVTGGGDDYMRLWDLEAGEKRWSTRTRFYPRPDFSPDGKTLFVHYDPEELRLYDVETKEIVEKFNPLQRQAIEEFAFLPGGRSMITVGAEGNRHGILSVWDVPSGEVILSVEKRHSKFSQLAMTADSKRFYTAGNEFVCLWNGTPLEELKAVAVGTMLYGVAITPDGNNVFTTSSASARDNELRCWTGDLELRGAIPAPGSALLAMSPDGRTLATGRGDNLVRLWDVETFELKAILSGHFGTVQGVDFSPDGQTLASACDSDNTVRLWDLSQLD